MDGGLRKTGHRHALRLHSAAVPLGRRGARPVRAPRPSQISAPRRLGRGLGGHERRTGPAVTCVIDRPPHLVGSTCAAVAGQDAAEVPHVPDPRNSAASAARRVVMPTPEP